MYKSTSQIQSLQKHKPNRKTTILINNTDKFVVGIIAIKVQRFNFSKEMLTKL
jgi:hypothetical protein